MAIAGIQFHIKHFGYITLGPQLDLIEGTDKSYDWDNGNIFKQQ